MLSELFEITGLGVYSPDGLFLGNVDNVVVNLESNRVDGLFINDPNPLLVEDSRTILVPYRWIASVGDIILLKYFPSFVTAAGQKQVRRVRQLPIEIDMI